MTPTPTHPHPHPRPRSRALPALLPRMLAAVATAVAVAGCASHSDPDHAGHSARAEHAAHPELSPGEFVEDSIFHLESKWTGDDGAARPLSRALGGKPSVAAMIYTSCEHACPVIVSDMLKIRRALGAEESGVRFALFSFDPARDTPRRLGEYRGRQRLPGWTILAPADAGAERELAAALGVRFKPIPGGDFAHSNIIFILDADGVPRHRQAGLLQAPDESAAVLRALLKK